MSCLQVSSYVEPLLCALCVPKVSGLHARQGEEVGSGLLTYPTLMAADILLYQVSRAGPQHSAVLVQHMHMCIPVAA